MSCPSFLSAPSIVSDQGLLQFRRMQFWNFPFGEKIGPGAILIFYANAR